MALSPRLELRQSQSLVMTPQLMQAIKLLQLSSLDLVAYVDRELERNPLLERDESEPVGEETIAATPTSSSEDRLDESFNAAMDNEYPDDYREAHGSETSGTSAPALSDPWSSTPSRSLPATDLSLLETTVAEEINLAQHVLEQFHVATSDPALRLIGQELIDSLDDNGYLTASLERVAERLGASLELVEKALTLVQSCDPAGIGARNLKECLALQLKDRNRFDPAMEMLIDHLDLLARHELDKLRKLCQVDKDDFAEMIAEIKALDPKPGRRFASGVVQAVIPDVYVRMGPDGAWRIDLNQDSLPKVLINQSYYTTVAKSAKQEDDKAFLNECMQNANWLVRSLDQRAKTILKVASEIVRQQDMFFAYGVQYLKPLNLKSIADAIEMHESTVSRVTSNKYIATSRGIFEMRYFFTPAIAGANGSDSHSAESVRQRIKALIDREDPKAILSDDTIVEQLRAEGIDIARRTVAKYREAMRIPSSVQRRREKRQMSA